MELNKEYKMNVTRYNCENRWRVIERNYKKYNTGKTQRDFKYLEDCDEIFGRKRNIRPAVLIHTTTDNKIIPIKTQLLTSNLFLTQNNTAQMNTKTNPETSSQTKICKQCNQEIVTDVSEDIMKYRKEKLELRRTQIEIDKERLIEEKRQNDLMEKHNELLEKYLKHKIEFPSIM